MPAPNQVTTITRSEILAMTRDEWERTLRESNVSIGGSSVGAILGISTFQTAADVWNDMLGAVRRRTPPSRQRVFDRGHMLEPIAVAMYENATGYRTDGDGIERYQDRSFPFLHATPDRFIHRPDGTIGLLEAKVLSLRPFQQTVSEGVSPNYVAQLMHYLGVLRKEWGAFAIYSPEVHEVHVVEMEWDEVLITQIRTACIRFWEDCVLDRRCPDGGLIASLAREVGALVPRAVGANAVTIDNPQVANVWRVARAAHESKALAERAWEEARAQVEQVMANLGHDRVRVAGVGTISYTPTTRRVLDRDAVRNAGIDLTPFEEAAESMTLRPRWEPT